MRSRTVWQRHVRELDGLELVGVHDVAQESLDKAEGLAPEQAFTDLDRMLSQTAPDALIVCPIHAAHAWAATAGLEAGCHVFVEKPFTTELSDALRLVTLASERDLRLGVVQNWRTKSVGQALYRAVGEGAIGHVSHVFLRYLRDREKPHLPDYLFAEPDPLLYAVSIHHFDLFRYVLRDEITVVEGRGHRPRWSRYEHASVNQFWMETEGGVAIAYTSTFSSRNGGHFAEESYQLEGELGTLFSETNSPDPPLLLSRRGDEAPIDLTADAEIRDSSGQYALADRTLLENFRDAVVDGAELIAPGSDNVRSLAVVEAARRALHERRPV